MIEVPAAAAIADLLAREVDFFSIGTNDLLQYFLAGPVQRIRFLPLQASPPRSLASFKVCHRLGRLRWGKDVALCGEMAADPLAAVVLLGLGLRTFSESDFHPAD